MKKAKVLNYTVKIYPAEEGGFWAKVPVLPGCHTQGRTIEEVLAMAHEAIECHIASLLKLGEPIPIEPARKIKATKSFSIPLSVSIPKFV